MELQEILNKVLPVSPYDINRGCANAKAQDEILAAFVSNSAGGDKERKMSEYLNISQCRDSHVYFVDGRNFSFGLYNAEKKSFTGIRYKFGDRFLSDELHWDVENNGTVKPIREVLYFCGDDDELFQVLTRLNYDYEHDPVFFKLYVVTLDRLNSGSVTVDKYELSTTLPNLETEQNICARRLYEKYSDGSTPSWYKSIMVLTEEEFKNLGNMCNDKTTDN